MMYNIRVSHTNCLENNQIFIIFLKSFFPPSLHFEPFCLSLDELWTHKENQHVVVYVWINFVCMFERDAFGASACLLCSCPRLSLTAMYNILLQNTTAQAKKRKHQMLWFNSPPVRANLSTVVPLMPRKTLISQWTDLISQMLLLQVSSPSWEDCRRQKVREVSLGNQYKRLNGLYAAMLARWK